MNKSFLSAFKRTIPIMAGFFPLGLAYGILMMKAGYSFLWTGLTSVTVLAGSLQFLMLDFFASGVPIGTIIVMALLLNSRHIFYGLSFVEKFKEYGPWKYFMIYSLSDESYSLLCSNKPQEGTNEKTVNLFSSGFVVFYWTTFSMLGGLIGSWITFDTTGIDFALTALFVVILLDQMRGAKNLLPVGIAAVSCVICILVFGTSNFILPSLAITVAALLIFRTQMGFTQSRKEDN
ncbi:MAG: AzlC family ABC transporter permease [Clostridiaceae bacterium]|nr:AzlC family ABC transporter permease [Feifaniaceae bacterium]